MATKLWPPHPRLHSQRYQRFFLRKQDPWRNYTITFKPTITYFDPSTGFHPTNNCTNCTHGKPENNFTRCTKHNTFPLTQRCVCDEYEGFE